ncbi:hypothetical protein RchiOBHm_Chr2g0112021 [Rosa chinensis]|uniref:Uncharacterized protein n=1 Tax=Rosa chinensis TaxID=74649 RepID=A0A2P6RQ37_ROSCH|nr:hypothetical protein RchiOBHm_Chr2g0112021 [Rosa chinensis]
MNLVKLSRIPNTPSREGGRERERERALLILCVGHKPQIIRHSLPIGYRVQSFSLFWSNCKSKLKTLMQ